MATPVKKKRLHQLPAFIGDKTAAASAALVTDGENEFQIPLSELGGGSETKPYQSLFVAQGAVRVDPNVSDDFIITLNDPSTTITLVDIENPLLNIRYEIQLSFVQGSGANKVIWPANVAWPNGAVPVLSYTAGAEDIIVLMSTDGGGHWRGAIRVQGY
ncbi:hypothetical protein pEaSNUABM29_00027 [Erwinia phage pEa_SNUABM_29]|nr:hypothetical protein pEaSNUABM29_00027 [Erwinia phage pEa_SNUABM_29]